MDIDYTRLAEHLMPRLNAVIEAAVERTLSGRAHPEWADKFSNPYGSERAFLEAARRCEFKTFRRNRRITAAWTDAVAAIKRTRGAGRKPKPTALPVLDIDKLVEESKPRRHKGSDHG
jgi:hypothetical protein